MKYVQILALLASTASFSAMSLGAHFPGAYACQAQGERTKSFLGSRVIKFSSRYLATESLAREEALDRCKAHKNVNSVSCEIEYCVADSMADIDDRGFYDDRGFSRDKWDF